MLRRLVLVVFAVLAMTCVSAEAQVRHPHSYYGQGVQPLDRILPHVRAGHPGRFYDAEGPFPDPMGGWHYRLKWMTPQGRIIWLDANARTGRVVPIPPGPRGGFAFGPPPVRGYPAPYPERRFHGLRPRVFPHGGGFHGGWWGRGFHDGHGGHGGGHRHGH